VLLSADDVVDSREDEDVVVKVAAGGKAAVDLRRSSSLTAAGEAAVTSIAHIHTASRYIRYTSL